MSTFAAVGSSALTGDREAPHFVKYAGNPLLTSGVSGQMPSLYWPWVLRVDDKLASPINRYYMWVSTDHAGADGYIGLYTAPTVTGPWTYYGQVFKDETSGNETETPSVVWVPSLSLFYMYYQQVGSTGHLAAQTTNLATSPDGVTWTRVGIALDVRDSTTWPQSTHTGYLRPHLIAGKWVAYSLLAGGDRPRFGISYSADGITWQLDPRPLGYGAEYLTDESERIEWNSTSIIRWRGQLTWVGIISSFASGAGDRTGRWCYAPISQDMRSLAGPPRQLFGVTQGWESQYMAFGSLLLDGGRLHLFYRSGYPTTGVGLATAEVAA